MPGTVYYCGEKMLLKSEFDSDEFMISCYWFLVGDDVCYDVSLGFGFMFVEKYKY